MDSNGFGTDRERQVFLKANPGILTRIARSLQMSTAAVSRTFHGVTKETTPRVVRAIQQAVQQAQKKEEVR
jgi:hypothetical protein